MDNEIISVPHWDFIWWDKFADREFVGALTGTPTKPLPPLERRYVQLGERKVHAPDGGVLETKFVTRWEGAKSFTTYWQECSQCGKRFHEQEF